MKKSTIAVLVLLLVLAAGALLLLNAYKLDLIHTIVVNAVVQKAPADFPDREVREAFARARRSAERTGQGEKYLHKLLQISQRLEKVQSLSAAETRELLDDLLC